MTRTHPRLEGPKAKDGLITYYGLVPPDNLVAWAVNAMNNSYSPYSGQKEGVLIRTERGDIATGTNVETINWDGLSAIQVALGRLFVQQPWADHTNAPEQISDVIFALPGFDAGNPDSFVPAGSTLEWLKKFGSPDTVLHFATPDKGITVQKTLHDILPYGPRMKALGDYLDQTKLFSKFLREASQQPDNKPDDVSDPTWHSLRRSRLHAFAPFSGYRVSVVVEAEAMPLQAHVRADLERGLDHIKADDTTRAAITGHLFNRLARFAGINIELSGNDALHAEGAAIGSMITDLGPNAKLSRVFLQGGFNAGAGDCHYCGKCRQLINEFSTAQTVVHVVAENNIASTMPNAALLPGSFAKLG